jgi:hypothetical protein
LNLNTRENFEILCRFAAVCNRRCVGQVRSVNRLEECPQQSVALCSRSARAEWQAVNRFSVEPRIPSRWYRSRDSAQYLLWQHFEARRLHCPGTGRGH